MYKICALVKSQAGGRELVAVRGAEDRRRSAFRGMGRRQGCPSIPRMRPNDEMDDRTGTARPQPLRTCEVIKARNSRL